MDDLYDTINALGGYAESDHDKGYVEAIRHVLKIVEEYTTEKLHACDKTKPSIDWSHVSEEYTWLAIDSDGMVNLFSGEPITSTGPNGGDATPDHWHVRHFHGATSDFAGHFSSLVIGDCDWTDSKIKREEDME